MFARPLIDQSLAPITERFRLEGVAEYRLAPHITLDRPLNTFDCWCEVEPIGNRPHEQWSPRIALELLTAEQADWPLFEVSSEAQGSSRGSTFAVHPRAHSPLRTMLHELGHIELGHSWSNTRTVDCHSQREAEAELVSSGVMALIGAVDRRHIAVSRYYLHYYVNQMERPFTESELDKVSEVIKHIYYAGLVTT